MYPGLRFAADHYQTLCCHREALAPSTDGNFETADGTPITPEHFPDAEVVCPECGRTWPPECEHKDIKITDNALFVEDGHMTVDGKCTDCSKRVTVALSVDDALEYQ